MNNAIWRKRQTSRKVPGLISLLMLTFLSWAQAPPKSDQPVKYQSRIVVTEVGDDHLLYMECEPKGEPMRLSLSDMDVSDRVKGNGNELGVCSTEVPPYRDILIERHLARLKYDKAAAPHEKAVQEQHDKATLESNVGHWVILLGYWSFGGLSLIGSWSLIAYYLSNRSRKKEAERQKADEEAKRKHPVVVVTGLADAGKTSLLARLGEEHLSRAAILGTVTTAGPYRKTVVVPFKGHEIEFTFKDSPGVRHELLWDELLVGPDALLLVLSPTTRKDKGEAEERFIRDQLMFVRAVVAGYLGSLKVGKKPRMVIIFVGKFDLFSRVQPEQAQGELDRLEAQFADHVQAVRMAAGAAIRVYDIYGSAVEGWGRVSVLEAVLHGLYEA